MLSKDSEPRPLREEDVAALAAAYLRNREHIAPVGPDPAGRPVP